MIDREAEKAARQALIGRIKAGDSVKVSGGEYRGHYGIVNSVTDKGTFNAALVNLIGTEGDDVTIPLKDLVRKWPGLNPGDTPVGGWQKLLDRQDARYPRPAIGQLVQSKDGSGSGTITHIEDDGSIGYLLADTPVERITGNMGWNAPHELKIQTYNDGTIVHWSDYACDVKARAATPILDLPEPYCRIRKVIKTDRDWEAQDEVGNPIGLLLGEAEAYDLSIQLFWEFGL